MSFVSPEFAFAALLFFPVFWGFRTYPTVQLWFLVVASYLLYGTWSSSAALALLALSVFIWYTGSYINRLDRACRFRAVVMAGAVLGGLATLLVTKYYNFLRQTVLDLLPGLGLGHSLPIVDLVAPAGISFFTFQAMTYLVWQYRSDRQAQPLVKVMAFLAFWPTVLSGPILRADDFFRQIVAPGFGAPKAVPRAIYLILLGLVEKLVFENWLADSFVNTAFRYPENLDALAALAAIVGYSLQIFLDFAGYSLIVTGLALFLGYEIPANFAQPYLANNVREFWRRWHISLSSFIRDYLYIPLGGNRVGAIRSRLNIVIAMLASGVWHGASLNFVLWGVLHAAGVLVVGFTDKVKCKWGLPKGLGAALTFMYVSLAWVFFRSASVDDALRILRQLTVFPAVFELRYASFLLFIVLFFNVSRYAEDIERGVTAWMERAAAWRLAVACSFVSWGVIQFGPNGIPGFIYFKF
jgi:alginate O-acetyltransferase complex protein AlgI